MRWVAVVFLFLCTTGWSDSTNPQAKLSPALKRAVKAPGGKTLRVIAETRVAVPANAVALLAAKGLIITKQTGTMLTAMGTGDLVLLLAAQDEVLRIDLSRPVRPSGKDKP